MLTLQPHSSARLHDDKKFYVVPVGPARAKESFAESVKLICQVSRSRFCCLEDYLCTHARAFPDCITGRTTVTMVLLVMTRPMVDGIKQCSEKEVEGWPLERFGDEPPLEAAAIGQPISHGQVVDISKILRKHFEKLEDGADLEFENGQFMYSLETLLKGSKVYIQPPKPKPSPVWALLQERLCLR